MSDGLFAFAKVRESVSGRASDDGDRLDDMAQQQPLYHSLGRPKNVGLNLHFEVPLPHFAVTVDAPPVRLLVVLLSGDAPPLPHRASRHPHRRRRRVRERAPRRRPPGRRQRRRHRHGHRQRGLSGEA